VLMTTRSDCLWMVDALVCGSLDSRRLRRRKWPVAYFNAERLCRAQRLIAAGRRISCLWRGDAAAGRSAERAANMPPGGTHWRRLAYFLSVAVHLSFFECAYSRYRGFLRGPPRCKCEFRKLGAIPSHFGGHLRNSRFRHRSGLWSERFWPPAGSAAEVPL